MRRTLVLSLAFLPRQCIFGKAQFQICQPDKTTAPRLQPPLKLLVCWLIVTQTFLIYFQQYWLPYKKLEPVKSEHQCHWDAPQQCCNKQRFSVVDITPYGRYRPKCWARGSALLGNADSTLKFGFTDATHHCLEIEIMKFISAQVKEFCFHWRIRNNSIAVIKRYF